MTEDNSEDDWTNYSSAQYGTGENIFEAEEINESNLLIDDLDFYDDNYEISPAPSISGQTHLVKIGCCDFCLGRVGGVSLVNRTLEEVGAEIRNEVLKHNPDLENIEKICPS